MKTELRTNVKNDFEKDFQKLIYIAIFRKAMKNVTKHRYIKVVRTEARRNYFVSEPNYQTTYLLKTLASKKRKNL